MKEEESIAKKGKVALLTELFESFKNGLLAKKSVSTKAFLDQIGLDHYKVELGYNSGQFHHNKSEELKKVYFEIGVLIQTEALVNSPDKIPFTIVGKEGIVFPLRNKARQMLSYASYRYKLDSPLWEHLNTNGVYPAYPANNVTHIYLCQTEIEAATLLQADVLEHGQTALALRNGTLTTDIKDAIAQSEKLQSITFVGNPKPETLTQLKAQNRYSIQIAELPENSINEVWTKYGAEAITEIIQDVPNHYLPIDSEKDTTHVPFTAISETAFHYAGEELNYTITGSIPQNTSLLDMQSEIESENEGVLRTRFNLFDSAAVEAKLFEWTENTEINYAKAILEVNAITKALEELRKISAKGEKLPVRGFSVKQDLRARALLKKSDLFTALNELIGASGIIGEDATRLLLFLIASSYKFNYNLHAVIQTDDKEKGAELTQKIAALIPEIDRYELDLTSARTFRYYGQTINNKLLVIPAYKGITESKAIKDLKRLQARGIIVNDTPKKGSNGLLYTTKQEVKGHTSSIGACNKSKRYFENEPKTVLVGMDSSMEQQQRLMEYDCNVMAGLMDEADKENAIELLQYVISNIHPQEVVNPFANKLMLPIHIPNARALTMQLMNFVNIVTLFKQYQRQLDDRGRLITEREDIQVGIDLFLDAIMVNIDEIDATTRDFFDRLKALYKTQPSGEKTALSSFEIRHALKMSKTTANRMLRTLVEYEYVKKAGYKNTGFLYGINNWNELEEIKQSILSALEDKKG